MKITFVSNYINHHQIPFCRAIIAGLQPEDEFFFIQTREMEADRKNMGWGTGLPEFVKESYVSPEAEKECRELIFGSDVVIFGGCEDESYISPRLEALREGAGKGKKYLTLRYSERMYREGQWKFITPKGLRKKYLDHTRYNELPVYLLCAGGYVGSDFSLFGAYKNKKYKWGYFTEVKDQNIEELLMTKGYKDESGEIVPYILWAGRFLKLKHADHAVKTAAYLKDKELEFHMDIVGDGLEKNNIIDLISKNSLEKYVTLHGFKKPDEVRNMMEKADIYLFTSDRNEGWGAVVNESMNSGCAVVAGSMIGSVPYLIRNGENGFVYYDGDTGDLFRKTEALVKDSELRKRLGRKAYETVKSTWNPEVAAKRVTEFIKVYMEGKDFPKYEDGPLSVEINSSEKKISKKAAGRA